MLVPLTRQKFEELIPRIATAAQYQYYWGKLPDFLKRLSISVVAVVVDWVISLILGDELNGLLFCIGLFGFFYWLWGPVLWASLRNREYRLYQFSGFFRGEILDVFITEELVGKEETVNKRGELVILENRERRLNLEIGDETGFTTELQVPLRRTHQLIARGQVAEMLLLSNQSDLSRIARVTDVYLPDRNLWVSDYPYLRRDVFTEVSRQIRDNRERAPYSRRSSRRRQTRQSSRRDSNW
ncbi:MAG: phosphate ABC transporter permease [Chroococcidiopsidaceae cyanobacterium CP_BM_ER_R8_30]|nr:phosphate ABC transporter permease [Chroococcidiopsidaceae cyanobacterium CP_BM_ER_R8_30]